MRTSNTTKNTLMTSILLFLAMLVPGLSWADGGGGPSSGPSGSCRVQVGSHLVTFTAYQPQLSGSTPYCDDIPELGNTAIVFDYEGKALRNMTVEFEITKEPGGERFFYQPPEPHPTGTFTRNVNFTEPGDYTAHVTLIHEGQTYDSHVPFSVAEAHGLPISTIIIIAVVLFSIGYFFYLSNPAFQGTVNRLWKKIGQ
jgi:hypothetical protein